jgi:tetratricopeptide (TPR) repeat protein
MSSGLRNVAAVLLLLWVSAAARAEPPWLSLQARNYTVISQLSERDTRAWAADFDQFIGSLTGVLGFQAATLPPVTVVLFARDSGFDAYRPAKPSGAVARNVSGYFYRRENFGVIGLAAGHDDEATRSTIQHEGVHWLMSVDPAPQPRWFSEGIAELFSTFGVRGSNVHWGDPIGAHLRLLRTEGQMPMREFLAQNSSLFESDEHTGVYYAQAWALTHLLLLGGVEGRREQLAAYLRALVTQSPDEAFASAFGGDYDALQKALRDYVAQPRLHFGLTPRLTVESQYVLGPASPLAVETALGRLALASADTQLAHRHAMRLAELAPDAAGTHELVAYIGQRDDDTGATLEAARAAVAAGSRDAEMYLVSAAGTLPVDAAAARRRVGLIETAINLNRRSLGAYSLLIDALSAVTPTDEDVKFLALGGRVHPQEGFLHVGLAEQLWRQGKRAQAREALTAALALVGRQESPQADYARTLDASWRVSELGEQLDPLIAAGRYADADRLLAGVAAEDSPTREYVARMREFLQVVLGARATAGH